MRRDVGQPRRFQVVDGQARPRSVRLHRRRPAALPRGTGLAPRRPSAVLVDAVELVAAQQRRSERRLHRAHPARLRRSRALRCELRAKDDDARLRVRRAQVERDKDAERERGGERDREGGDDVVGPAAQRREAQRGIRTGAVERERELQGDGKSRAEGTDQDMSGRRISPRTAPDSPKETIHSSCRRRSSARERESEREGKHAQRGTRRSLEQGPRSLSSAAARSGRTALATCQYVSAHTQ